MIPTLTLKDIYRPIQNEMMRFDSMLQKELSSRDPLLSQLADHLALIAGKRLRPALAILSSRYCGDASDTPSRLALAIELLHTATLVHDDIVDGSMLRRNQKSVNARWGVDISIIAGDYIYAKAFLVLSSLDSPKLSRLLSHCAQMICEGELKQIETRSNLFLTEEEYLDIVYKKTATLFEAAALIGPTLQPVDEITRQALGDYGRNAGLAFQITDDCLDITGKEEELGKSPGLDMEKRDVTLPLIYLNQTTKGPEKALLEAWVNGEASREDFQRIRDLALRENVVARAMELARKKAARAREALEKLSDTESRKSLMDLTDYVIHRVQ